MHHDIELTKKGEAYVHRHNPTGCPAGIEPHVWRKALQLRVEQHLALVTALVGLLDGLDGDCDLEDGGDHEPSLGGGDLYTPQGFENDLELDQCDHEPLLGSPEIGAQPSIWATGGRYIVFQASQTRWANGRGAEEEEGVNEDGDDLDAGEGDPAEYDSGETIFGGGSGRL